MLRERYSAEAYSLHFYVQSNYEHGNECVTGKYRSYGRLVCTIVRWILNIVWIYNDVVISDLEVRKKRKCPWLVFGKASLFYLIQ